jgi:hypothetical protein
MPNYQNKNMPEGIDLTRGVWGLGGGVLTKSLALHIILCIDDRSASESGFHMIKHGMAR